MEKWSQLKEHTETREIINMEISSFGRIRITYKRITKKRGLIRITYGSNTKGYKETSINRRKYKVHQLVARNFIGECPDGFECDHKDRNRSNNHIDNLRWVSKSDNCNNRIKKGSIKRTKNNTYIFRYSVNKNKKSKTFKTLQSAKVAQAFYKGAIDIVECC